MAFPNYLFGKPLAKIHRTSDKRRYPIKRDEYGYSARARAFDLFDLGRRPKDVCREVDISLTTACRYFHDWKKAGGRNARSRLSVTAQIIRRKLEVSDEVVQKLAEYYDVSPDEIIARAQKPWGVLRLLRGGWPNRRLDKEYGKQDKRLRAALELIKLFEVAGHDPELVSEIIDKITDELKKALKKGEKRKLTINL